MNPEGHAATLVASHPGNGNACTHGVFDEHALRLRTNEFAASMLEELGQVGVVTTARVWETARLMAFVERLDHWVVGLGGSPPPPRQRYLLEIRLRSSKQLEKLLAALDGWRAPGGSARVLEGEQADQVAELRRIAFSDPSATTGERLQAHRLLIVLGINGTSAGALAEDKRRREGEMTRAFHGRRHIKAADGTWVAEERAS